MAESSVDLEVRNVSTIAFASSMSSIPWGGSEVLWYETAEECVNIGHTVAICTPKWPKLPEPLERAKNNWGIQHSFDHTSPQNYFVGRILRRIARRDDLHQKRLWLRKIRPSIFCLSNGCAFQGLAWMKAAMAEAVPFVTIAQAQAEFHGVNDLMAEQLISAFFSARANYFVARANQELVECQLGYRFSNARLIANHSRYLPLHSPMSWPDQPADSLRLACVARLHPESKGHDLLFQALSDNRWNTRNWQLSLYGVGEQENCLRRLASILGISHRIHFMGQSSKPMGIWRTHHALVLPSRYEGTPLVLMEAMLAGRPVITTAVAGAPELIQHGQNGFLAEAPTVKNILLSLEEAWARRAELSSMGIAAHATAKERAKEAPALRLSRELLSLSQQ